MWFKQLLKKNKSGSSNSLRRLSLMDDTSAISPATAIPERGALSVPPLTRISKGSLASSSSCSSAGSLSLHGGNMSKVAEHNPVRRQSLPAIHLGQRNSYMDSCGIMSNPPVFDNPLRRRGCCNHKYTEQMSGYRAEAIQRELSAKLCNARCEAPVLVS